MGFFFFFFSFFSRFFSVFLIFLMCVLSFFFLPSLSEIAVTGLLQQIVSLKRETMRRFGGLETSQNRNDTGLIMKIPAIMETLHSIFFFFFLHFL